MNSGFSSEIYNFVLNYGYIAVFLGLLVEGTGMPGPVEILFFASGYLIAKGSFSLWAVIVIATLGNLAGNIIMYILGYYGGRPLVDKYGKYFKIKDKDIEKVSAWFNKYGGVVAFISRLIGVTRTPAIWTSGIMRMNFTVYALFSLFGDFLWASFWTIVGAKSMNILSLVKSHNYILYIAVPLFIAVVIFVWWKFIKIYKGKKK